VSTLPRFETLPSLSGDRGEVTDAPAAPASPPADSGYREFILARRQFLDEISALPRPPRAYFIAKRTLDLVAAILIALLTLPVALLIVTAILIDDRGPVFFRQQRTGLGGRRFTMFKFRTMCTNAEEMKAELQHLSVVAFPDFKMENDPRITRVGRLLRATFLDELPQLINVIRGEMSLVGPRPTSFAASTYSLWHTERLEAKPGVTGLWQVRRGAEETCLDERLRLDVEYLRTRSLDGDLRLMVETVVSTLRRKGK
jgi:lipopolysaccharide/colanic/teichoic acid biosynthesis glycosyltransferase